MTMPTTLMSKFILALAAMMLACSPLALSAEEMAEPLMTCLRH